jgi:hypothetical protein
MAAQANWVPIGNVLVCFGGLRNDIETALILPPRVCITRCFVAQHSDGTGIRSRLN